MQTPYRRFTMKRNEAYALHQKQYDAEKPCIHGHPMKRYTKSGICVECSRMNTDKWKDKHMQAMIATRLDVKSIDGILVHTLAYDMIMELIAANNALMGLPAHINQTRHRIKPDIPVKMAPCKLIPSPFPYGPRYISETRDVVMKDDGPISNRIF